MCKRDLINGTPIIHASFATAILDRFLHHAEIIQITGKSYRLKPPMHTGLTGKERAVLRGHTDVVLAAVFSPNGKTLASGSGDHSVILWDLTTSKKRAILRGHHALIHCLDFSADGTTLASGSCDETIKLWDIDKETEAVGTDILTPKDLDNLWIALAGDDATKAYQAINRLNETPQQAIALIKGRVRPVSEPNAQEINRCINDLESNQFMVRQSAWATKKR